MDIQKEIVRVTSEYFENDLDYLKLSNATKEFKAILNDICGQNMDTQEGRSDIQHVNGKALGTFWAAFCLDDLIRTRQFVRGLDLAIKEKLKNKPIHILYAGTGPFATLILPIIFKYPKRDIKYTLLEVNPLSFQILQNVISKLGLEDYDITLDCCDATQYNVNPKNEPDIILSETMQNALSKEQQVPIFLNLMSQVNDNTIFIPEKIEIHVGFRKSGIPIEELQKKHYQKIDKVFELSKASMFYSNLSEEESIKKDPFAKRKTKIESDKLKGAGQLLLITEIQVFKNERITLNQSGLTIPIPVKDISEIQIEPIVIETQYIISSEPKLEYFIT